MLDSFRAVIYLFALAVEMSLKSCSWAVPSHSSAYVPENIIWAEYFSIYLSALLGSEERKKVNVQLMCRLNLESMSSTGGVWGVMASHVRPVGSSLQHQSMEHLHLFKTLLAAFILRMYCNFVPFFLPTCNEEIFEDLPMTKTSFFIVDLGNHWWLPC